MMSGKSVPPARPASIAQLDGGCHQSLQPIMPNALVLLSGGMDSATLLFYVKHRLKVAVVDALSFDYGQHHRCELTMATWQARAAGVRDHRVIDLGFLGDMTAPVSALTGSQVAMPDLDRLTLKEREQPGTYVPHRNLVLLSLATAYAEARGIRDVFYGAQSQDSYGYWDCSADFLERLNQVLSLNRRDAVRIQAPFVAMRKADEIRLGMELGVNYARTWTCYRGGPKPCDDCPACRERRSAFDQIGIADPARG